MIRFREGTSSEEDVKVTGEMELLKEQDQWQSREPRAPDSHTSAHFCPMVHPLPGEVPRRRGELWKAGNLQLVRFGIRASLQTTTA